jgi:hypothetical protein
MSVYGLTTYDQDVYFGASPEDVTVNGQVWLRGLLMGENTNYCINTWTMRRAPEIRVADQSRSRQWGVFPGLDTPSDRRLSLQVSVVEETGECELYDAYSDVAGAFRPSETDLALIYMRGDRRQLYIGRPRLADPDESSYYNGFITADCRFVCTDPRSFEDPIRVASVAQPTASVGRTYPLEFPRVYGSIGLGGQTSAANIGNAPTPWVARFVGPVDNPRVLVAGTNLYVQLNGSISAGQFVDVDSYDRTVLLNGEASRYQWLDAGSRWFDLQPGTTDLRFIGASGSGTLEFRWRSAWL